MSGPELVGNLLRLRPDVRVLYISAFPPPILDRQASLPPESGYLQKPFPIERLLEKIEALLGDLAAPTGNRTDAGGEPGD